MAQPAPVRARAAADSAHATAARTFPASFPPAGPNRGSAAMIAARSRCGGGCACGGGGGCAGGGCGGGGSPAVPPLDDRFDSLASLHFKKTRSLRSAAVARRTVRQSWALLGGKKGNTSDTGPEGGNTRLFRSRSSCWRCFFSAFRARPSSLRALRFSCAAARNCAAASLRTNPSERSTQAQANPSGSHNPAGAHNHPQRHPSARSIRRIRACPRASWPPSPRPSPPWPRPASRPSRCSACSARGPRGSAPRAPARSAR